MIIDAHTHLGSCRVFGAEQAADELLGAMDAAGVDTAVVQPFPGAPDPAATHDEIAALGERHPGRIAGLASLNPHRDPDDYKTEIHRCVEELGFVAVKVHTVGHAVRPGSEDAHLIFSTAAELGIAVMVHTGIGVPFAEPAAWVPVVQQYPETSVILGHAGAHIYTAPAIVAAQSCDNIVLETSWCNVQDLRAAIGTLGAERVMFGSDMVFNVRVELAKYAEVELSTAQRDLVLAGNARRVFGLDGEAGGSTDASG